MKSVARPSWDEYFIDIAQAIARRGTCARLQVGCVAVRDKMILVTGYNGSPKGAPHCIDVGCEVIEGHCERAIHAEANALVQAALHGVSLANSTIYVTHTPCRNCMKLLVGAGVERVVFRNTYDDKVTAWLASEHGVEMHEFTNGAAHQ